ncbi:MAG: hypothetical protein J2P15_12060 [Micromonosporaceae bacterium]|nr:hypothetical protein [Micromonosporaceae bacterium]
MNLQSEVDPLLPQLWEAAEANYMQHMSDKYSWTDSAEADAQNIADMKQAFERIVGPAVSDLVRRFRSYYSLDDFDLDPVADEFANEKDRWEEPGSSLFCHIVAASKGIQQVDSLVHSDQWTGTAAMAFKNNFLDPFQGSAVTQVGCTREIAIAARSLARAVQLAKECVVWICKNTIWNLHASPGGEYPGPLPGETSEDGTKKIAGMTAILADTAATFMAFVPGLDVLDLGLAATGVIGGSIAESAAPSAQDAIAFAAPAGALAQDVISAAAQALTALDKNIADVDDQIWSGLDKDLGAYGVFSKAYIGIYSEGHGEHSGQGGWLGYPDLAPSAYQGLTSKGNDTKQDGVVVNFRNLYYAATVNMPLVADQYAFGIKVCNGVRVTGVDHQFRMSVPKLNEAAETFGRAMQSTHDHCVTYAQAMLAAARDYEWTDAYESGRIRDLEGMIHPPDPSLPPDTTVGLPSLD